MEEEYKPTKEEEEAIHKDLMAYEKSKEQGYKKDQELLDKIKKEVSNDFYKKIVEEIEETGGGWNLKIVDSPPDIESEGYDDREVWVDQRSVGESGDSFEGEVYIKLPNGKYLRWDYEM